MECSSNNGGSTSMIVIKELDGNECSQISTVNASMENSILTLQFLVANSDLDASRFDNNKGTFMDLLETEFVLKSSEMNDHSGDSIGNVISRRRLASAITDVCMICLGNQYIFTISSKKRSNMRVRNSNIYENDGIVSLIENHEESTYTTLFDNVLISDSVTNDGIN